MRLVVYVVFGAVAGWAWYRLVGCSTGSCPITANPWTSAGYGALMGAMLGSQG